MAALLLFFQDMSRTPPFVLSENTKRGGWVAYVTTSYFHLLTARHSSGHIGDEQCVEPILAAARNRRQHGVRGRLNCLAVAVMGWLC